MNCLRDGLECLSDLLGSRLHYVLIDGHGFRNTRHGISRITYFVFFAHQTPP